MRGSPTHIVARHREQGTIYRDRCSGQPSRGRSPHWTVEEQSACFVDANGQALSFVYFEDEPGRRSAAKLLTRAEARRIAAKIANLPKYCRKP